MVNIRQSVSEYKAALTTLNQYLIFPSGYNIDVDGDQTEDVENFSDLMPSDSLIDAPLLNLYKSRTNVSEAAWKTERAGYLPKLDLGYSLQSIDGRSGFHGWEAGISVPLLFFSQSGRTKAARINVEIAGQQYQQKELELNAKYSGMLSRYESMLDLLRYYKNEALPLAEEQIGAAYLGYRLGNIDYIQFIQNMESAIKTRQEYLIHLEDYYSLKEQLHYIAGN